MRLKENRPMKLSQDKNTMLFQCKMKFSKHLNVYVGCNEWKKDEEFSKGYNICKQCDSKKQKRQSQLNPEQKKIGAKRRQLKIKLTEEKWTKEDSKKVMDKFDYKCFNCETSIQDAEYITIDHNQPLNLGYPLTHENAVPLCNLCNSAKGRHTSEEFYHRSKLKKLKSMGINLNPKRYLLPLKHEIDLILNGEMSWEIQEYENILN